MKVTLNWLKRYVDFNWSPAELAERLTLLGLEVEGVHKIGGEFDGIVVAQILTKDKVPGADKLSVCKVHDGKGERTIICGAQNHNVGDKVPLILPNFALPLKPGDKEPFVIKERKVFGITSQGMMCSPQELGLPDPIDGLLILPADAPVGKPFAEYLGRAGGDVVYDLEITPNRPDWNSVIGIAREIAALTGNELKVPRIQGSGFQTEPSNLNPEPLKLEPSLPVSIRLDDPDLCPRYTARVIRGVKVGPSPDWLRSALEKVGLRSISNVVDVTNYVMLECGQPLHAFDYHLIARAADGTPTIVVRRARAGEKFTTLDGQERTLTDEALLIADEQKGIALAGVMGGQNSEINDRTVDVLLESACFKPTNIRRTSKTLGLRTDASYRFERGADIGICDWASRRAAQLILETAGGQLAGEVADAYPAPAEPRQITLRHAKVNALLGLELKPEEIEFYLGQLGLKVASRKPRPLEAAPAAPEPVTLRIPTWRVDLKREADLIEEVGRLHGVDRIPATPPRGALGSNAYDAVHDQLAEARRILSGLGLNEAQGQTLISERFKELFEPKGLGLVTANWVYLQNPLSQDMNVLRPTLLPGLLEAITTNIHRGTNDVALFEIGRVFFQNLPEKPKERRNLAIVVTGNQHQPFWAGENREAKYDGYDLKGFLEEFLEQFGIRGVIFRKHDQPNWLFHECWALSLGRLVLGSFGQLNPVHGRAFDVRSPVYMAELDLDELLVRRNAAKSFKALPQFPTVRRDVAMIVPEATTHETVLAVVRQAKPANLERIELFDVFRGKQVPPGQKSLAYAFTYRHAERTLTDADVNAAHEKLVEQFKQRLAAVVRDA